MRQLESSLYEKLTNFSGDNVWVESGIVKKIVETNYQVCSCISLPLCQKKTFLGGLFMNGKDL